MYVVVFPLENGGPLFGDKAVEILLFNIFFFSLVMIVFKTQNPLSYPNILHSIFVTAFDKRAKGDTDFFPLHHNILSVRMNFTPVGLVIF
jgi:hypothetical protein